MNRRTALKLFGAAAGVGLGGRYLLLPPSRSGKLRSVHELAVELHRELDADARKLACVDYDHPLRQYHNRGVGGGGLAINSLSLGWAQRALLTDLLYAGLSEPGQSRVPEEFFIRFPGVHLMKVLFCGDPTSPPYQLILTGPHLNLRLGGKSREGVAFGGPQVYGDQRGNSQQGLPGNLYRYQLEIAHRLFQSLRPEQQRLALQEKAPIQTQVELQGSGGSFAGVKLETLAAESRAIARELVDGILSTYAAEDATYAMECLEANGGVERLFLSYYREGEVDGSGQYQIFRLEGPAAVFYFRGYPHVHAFINVAKDGDAPLSVGETLGENAAVLEGAAVKALFERAMQEQSGSDFAFYDGDSVVGRLRQGTIRAGDIYNLESWQDRVALVEIKGANLGATFTSELRARGIDPDPRRTYRVATTAVEELGQNESAEDGIMLREMTIAHVKRRGFESPS